MGWPPHTGVIGAPVELGVRLSSRPFDSRGPGHSLREPEQSLGPPGRLRPLYEDGSNDTYIKARTLCRH